MTLLAITPEGWAGTQILGAAGLAAIGVYQLLPRPGHRSVALGVFLCLAALGIAGAFLFGAFGDPSPDRISSVLFWFFSAGAVGFGTVLVAQSNPARGAMAFAFVVLSTCGLFLLLAAPFLMAATVIIYAGAVIVTFLFLLMLSAAHGPSDENDRTREPLLGSLAGFAFAGLIFFALFQQSSAGREGKADVLPDPVLPTPPLTALDRAELAQVRADLDASLAAADEATFDKHATAAHARLREVIAERPNTSIQRRLRPSLGVGRDADGYPKPVAADPRIERFVEQTERLSVANSKAEEVTLDGHPQVALKAKKDALAKLRDEVVVYSGNGLLPARNVANVGYLLYSEYLLAIEMAGTLLLVATIGAVAIAGRRGAVA